MIEAYLDRRFPAQAELGTRRRLGDGRPSVLQEVGERLRGDEDGHGDPKPDNTSDAERPRAREALAVELPVEDEGQQQRHHGSPGAAAGTATPPRTGAPGGRWRHYPFIPLARST